MTTHTDLIARLRRGWTTDCLLAADALEALEQQVAALTNERNDLLILLDNWKTSQGVTEDQLAAMTTERDELLGPNPVEQMIRDQLAAAQAREAKRLKTISDEATAIAFYGDQPPQWMLDLIALPTDGSALQERLKQEREQLIDDWTTTIATCYKSDDLLTAEQVVDLLCPSDKKADAIRVLA